jgi:hypothetical protein
LRYIPRPYSKAIPIPVKVIAMVRAVLRPHILSNITNAEHPKPSVNGSRLNPAKAVAASSAPRLLSPPYTI